MTLVTVLCLWLRKKQPQLRRTKGGANKQDANLTAGIGFCVQALRGTGVAWRMRCAKRCQLIRRFTAKTAPFVRKKCISCPHLGRWCTAWLHSGKRGYAWSKCILQMLGGYVNLTQNLCRV